MSNDKVCPIMSSQVATPLFAVQAALALYGHGFELRGLNYEMRYVRCIGDECAFWKEYTPTDNIDPVHGEL